VVNVPFPNQVRTVLVNFLQARRFPEGLSDSALGKHGNQMIMNCCIHPLMTIEMCSPDLLPNWLVMLLISLTMLVVLKSIALLHYVGHTTVKIGARDVAGWYLAWPGLNAPGFFQSESAVLRRPAFSEWSFAIAKCLLGALCLVEFVPLIAAWNRWVAGWVAMFGLLMLFHFGGFHLLALIWRVNGRSVQPIMNRPLLATSVNDFWSRRWNLAFRDFATQFIMRPLARRWSTSAGLWGCFVFSGLVHELAISVPARAGFGLPFSYFLLQGVGVCIERSALSRRIGLGAGWRGWLFAFLIVGPPAAFLFHPPFLTKVVLPLVGIPEVTSC